MTATDTTNLDTGEAAGPDIGRRAPDKPRSDIKPFTLYSYDDDGNETPHVMRARPDDLDWPTFQAFVGKDVTGFDRINALHYGLRKVLCDDDGVPAKNTVIAVVRRDEAWVPVSELADDDTTDIDELRFTLDRDAVFDTADEATADGFARGSSRRRYDRLMDPSSPEIVDNDTPAGVVQYLLSGGGPRPTKSSPASSGSRRTKKTRSGAG